MKKTTALLIGIIVMSGCARVPTGEEVINNITPSGCYYDFQLKEFDCIDNKQEEYLNSNLLTPEEMKKLNVYRTMDDSTMFDILVRLHDCEVEFGLRPGDSEWLCSYEFTADMVTRLSLGFNVTESRQDKKFHYSLARK